MDFSMMLVVVVQKTSFLPSLMLQQRLDKLSILLSPEEFLRAPTFSENFTMQITNKFKT